FASGVDTGTGIAAALQMDKGFEVVLDAEDTAESLRQKIETNVPGVKAEIGSDGKMVIKSAEGDDLVIEGVLADKLGVSGAATNGNNERAQYAQQFNDVLTQIDQLVTDTSYKGINLLKGDNLTVVFNESRTSTLELKGVTFDSTGLGLTASKGDWKVTADIDESLDQITKATSMLRAQASNFGQNLSTVQIRQDFTENMINELQTGADKLTLADNNEEAANMLALQTRQSLATKSLSLANQSAQAVLQLF
ncbi:MAG: flagellar protein, partial [Clostridia bacterium]|nr:flagellar protein [Clostridia bacterium]